MTSSPWAPEKAKEGAELRFEFREQAIDYMGELMRLHMFHRARKVPVAEKEKKKKKDETETEEEEKPSPKAKKGKKEDKKVHSSIKDQFVNCLYQFTDRDIIDVSGGERKGKEEA